MYVAQQGQTERDFPKTLSKQAGKNNEDIMTTDLMGL